LVETTRRREEGTVNERQARSEDEETANFAMGLAKA